MRMKCLNWDFCLGVNFYAAGKSSCYLICYGGSPPPPPPTKKNITHHFQNSIRFTRINVASRSLVTILST